MKPPPKQVIREYSVFRGDVFVGEEFRMRSALGASFWDSRSLTSQLRSSIDGEIVHTFNLSDSVSVDGVLIFRLEIAANQTAALTPGTYLGDIEVSSSGLPKRSVVFFKITVFADVTHT